MIYLNQIDTPPAAFLAELQNHRILSYTCQQQQRQS